MTKLQGITQVLHSQNGNLQNKMQWDRSPQREALGWKGVKQM